MIHWPLAALPCHLLMKVQEPGWSWSGAVAFERPEDVLLKIRNRYLYVQH